MVHEPKIPVSLENLSIMVIQIIGPSVVRTQTPITITILSLCQQNVEASILSLQFEQSDTESKSQIKVH